MSSEIIDLTVDPFLPEVIKQHWIPLDGLSVPHLFQFKQYPPPEMPYYDHSDLSQLLHKEEFSEFNFQTLLQFSPPPKILMDGYKNVIKVATSPIHSFTLIQLSGDSVKFPVWVLDYWREVGRATGYCHDWKKVLVWLRNVNKLWQAYHVFHGMVETALSMI
jgi:hypothetical protein